MKQIRLEHFRCYTDLSIDFKSGINLLIGDNASGKTTVLKACQYVLSSFLQGTVMRIHVGSVREMTILPYR